MTVSVKVVGMATAIRFLNNKRNKVEDKLIPQGLKNATIFLQGEVKQSIAGRRAEPTSVDTGRFLNSVDTQILSKKEAKVFTKLDYAKVLEFGSSSRQARRHFRNSKDRSKQKIKNLLNKEIKSI